jgi:hypothetical protein
MKWRVIDRDGFTPENVFTRLVLIAYHARQAVCRAVTYYFIVFSRIVILARLPQNA